MSKEKILVFGASGHAQYTIDIIEQEGIYDIIGIIDSNIEKGTIYESYKILGSVEDLLEIMAFHKVNKGIIGIGDNYTRYLKATAIHKVAPEFSFVSAVHPTAIVSKNVTIGDGSLIMAGVIITNDTTIGKHCFIATKASLAHHSLLNNFSSLGPGVTTGGNVTIGYCTAIGLGVNILHGKTIGIHSVVGAGALVFKDIEDYVVAYGTPAITVRQREKGEKYM